MRKFFVLSFCLLFLLNDISFSQAPVIVWQKCYGGYHGDYPHNIIATSDGGSIVAGQAEDNGGDVNGYHGNPILNDYWIVKLSSTGAMEWQKCIGGNSSDLNADIKQTSDGGYIVSGSSASIDGDATGGHGGLDYWVVKLTSTGNISWQKKYGGSKNDYAYSIDVTNDGGYIIAGHTESSDGDITVNLGKRDFWIIKIDATGNLKWQKSLGGTEDDVAYSVSATPDGGCIATGSTESTDGDVTGNHGKRDYWVTKLDNTGKLQWQKCLGGSAFDEAWSIQPTTDGGYIVAGYTASNDGDVSGNHQALGAFSDFWVVKLSSNGNIDWQKCYGGKFNEIAYTIRLTSDGGYLVGGSAESPEGDLTCNMGSTDMWVIKINSTGALQWQKSMGGSIYDAVYSLLPLPDGTCILAGFTCSSTIPGYHPQINSDGTCADYWIVKLSTPVPAPLPPVVTISPASGNVCAGNSASFTASVANPGTTMVYQWTKNGLPAGTSNPVYTAADFVNNDVIACTVTTGGVCETPLSGTNSVVVKVNPNPVQPQLSIAAGNVVVCNGATVTVKATLLNGGSSPAYQWKINGVNTGNNTDQYTSSFLKNGDVISCVYSDNSICITNGSVVSNSIVITVNSPTQPSVNVVASATNICQGVAATFTATALNAGINPVYQWQINGVNTGTNSNSFITTSLADKDAVRCVITVDPQFTCTSTNTANSAAVVMAVTPKVSPSVTIAVPSDTVCTGAMVTFIANVSNAGTNPAYQWKINGINIGGGNKIFATTSLVNGDKVTCSITADPQFTCINTTIAISAAIAMTVKNQLNPSVTITEAGNSTCAGNSITFSATTQNAGTSPLYQWKVNNALLSNHTQVFSSNTLLDGDVVFCEIIPATGACSVAPAASNSITAVVYPLPIIRISPVDTTIMISRQAQLKATLTGNISSYVWSPAGKLENPLALSIVTIPLTENTLYTLTAESDKACKSAATAIVKIARLVAMPAAFTPNGDHLNDVFRIPVNALSVLKEFSVFDRWGTKIFTTQDAARGWDGTLNGKSLNAGAYIYIIKGTDYKGALFLKGSVLLVR